MHLQTPSDAGPNSIGQSADASDPDSSREHRVLCGIQVHRSSLLIASLYWREAWLVLQPCGCPTIKHTYAILMRSGSLPTAGRGGGGGRPRLPNYFCNTLAVLTSRGHKHDCACLMACWRYGTALSILLLNTDSAVAPLSLTTAGILALQKFDWLIDKRCVTVFPGVAFYLPVP